MQPVDPRIARMWLTLRILPIWNGNCPRRCTNRIGFLSVPARAKSERKNRSKSDQKMITFLQLFRIPLVFDGFRANGRNPFEFFFESFWFNFWNFSAPVREIFEPSSVQNPAKTAPITETQSVAALMPRHSCNPWTHGLHECG